METDFRFSSIADMLSKHAQHRPDHECLYYPDRVQPLTYATLTYDQLNKVTNHLAHKLSVLLSQNELEEPPVICLLANSDTSYLLTIYALFKLNVIVYPLSVRNSNAAVIHLLEKSNVSYLLYSNEFSSTADSVRSKFGSKISLHMMEEVDIAQLISSEEIVFETKTDTNELDRIRIIFHSSGSTAYPKPIRLTTRYLFGFFESYRFEANGNFWSSDDTVLLLLPLFHVAGMGVGFAIWYGGGAVALPFGSVFPPPPSVLLANIEYPEFTKIWTVPLFLEQLIPLLQQDDNHGFRALARLQWVMVTGAACSPNICKELVENGVNVVISYGSTETGLVLISDFDKTTQHQWQRLRKLKQRQSTIKFLPYDHNSHIYELAIMATDPFLAFEVTTKEFYSPGDLFLEQPPGSEQYVIQGRNDDTLVHMTGEKTNPLPIELTIQQHPIVKRAIVLGHERLCCSVLIQLNTTVSDECEFEEIENQVVAAVQDANKDAPAHSRIVPSLIRILPRAKCLPVTNKGNVIRKDVNRMYGPMIEQMYHKFLNGSEANHYIQRSFQRSWTRDDVCVYLQGIVAHVLKKPISYFDDHSKSLYSNSLDSVTSIQLKNILCQEFGDLDHSILFEFSTINALADKLLSIKNNQYTQPLDDPERYKETEKIIDKYVNLIQTHPRKLITMPNESIDNDNKNATDKRIVLLTGANGSLGSHILLQLLEKPQVSRIYCLLRGADAPNRLRCEMEKRKQDITCLDDARVIILSMDLTDDKLGQTAMIYEKFQYEITDIIHSGWKMDFNLTIKDFDRECLHGLYHLLRLASNSSSREPMRFHFISSVGSSGSGLIAEVEEKPLPRRAEVALAQGYSQSKYAGEHICWAAMDHWEVPVDIYRVGQISGDTKSGVWNTAELISLMICTGGGEMGLLPEYWQEVDWIPVDYAASCICDIAIDWSTRTSPRTERVHHILNPHAISWSELLEHLKSAGLQFTTISAEEWVRKVLAEPNNSAYTLAGFLSKVFAKDKVFKIAQHKLEKTIHRTSALKCCPSIDQKLVQLYLNYWSEIGFLKHGSIVID